MSDEKDLEKFLNDNPEKIAAFKADNSDVLNLIVQRFKYFHEGGDVIGKYLLSTAMVEILTEVYNKSSEGLRQKKEAQLVPIGGLN